MSVKSGAVKSCVRYNCFAFSCGEVVVVGILQA